MMLIGQTHDEVEKFAILLKAFLPELRHGCTIVGLGIERGGNVIVGREQAVGQGRESDKAYAEIFKRGKTTIRTNVPS